MHSATHVSRTKRMRQGTRSCSTCRSRKVRCVFPSDQSRVCANCLRRGETCVPQGIESDADLVRAADAIAHLDGQGSSSLAEGGALEPLRAQPAELEDALEQRRRSPPTHLSQRLSSPHLHRECGEAQVADPLSLRIEQILSESAPLVRLFNNSIFSQEDNVNGMPGVENMHVAGLPNPPPKAVRHAAAVKDLCSAMPSHSEMKEIFDKQSGWWNGWRTSLDLFLGDEEDVTLEKFASRAFSSGHPSLLGNLLVCFAISTDEHERYLAPVERWILNDDELAGCLHGLRCLLGIGLILLASMQPRRAVSVFRRANTLLQMKGIHRTHRKSKELDSIFWQFFHADRWVHLILGLPYSVPDHLCDLHIPPIGHTTPAAIFHRRHFAVLTGRVIDCLQDINGCLLSKALQVEEQMDKVAAQLPEGYLNLAQISLCPEPTEKYTRLLRVRYMHQLKAFLHLPLFLQTRDWQGYSRRACIDSSRILLESFLQMANNNLFHNGVVANLEAFAAFTSAVVLFLHLAGYGMLPEQQEWIMHPANQSDERLILDTLAALKRCSNLQGSSLSYQCHVSLRDLVSSVQALEQGEAQIIVLPFFGKISVKCKRIDTIRIDGNSQSQTQSDTAHAQRDIPSMAPRENFDLFSPFEDIDFAYEGQWLLDSVNSFSPMDY
ncbi:hypothetical protein B0J12DRAFT_691952 [Macrophomina phaseolina]|uniref:Zn(2)-C6 fungal-type domain-containing protein n=1 Tax=Macrophomina phaseolina TaxID=35725 RepID=A0ABQ8FPQ7_9PEZI|nr:hypothetical protein B0J12DRAFT_691952 [Macrophomina phaseolina]